MILFEIECRTYMAIFDMVIHTLHFGNNVRHIKFTLHFATMGDILDLLYILQQCATY